MTIKRADNKSQPARPLRQVSEPGEFGLIKSFRARCSTALPEILKGIGDDAAVIRRPAGKTLITTDMMIEGVHFDLSLTAFDELGHKILAVNVSDIFAMGGTPRYFVLGLGAPGNCKLAGINRLYSGMMKAAKKFNVAVVGGDTCLSKQGLVLSGTLIGEADKVVTRSGARPGDGIFVTGTPGDSAAGLMLLRKYAGKKNRLQSRARQRLIKKHLMPGPEPLRRTAGLTSMIDVSDGLLIDLSHICDESGVGAVVYRDMIPISGELAAAAKDLGADPFELALKGGEDYVLLFTAPTNIRTDAVKIGEITKKGRYLVDRGRKTRFKAEGYEHFK
ncbi:MAG TPA: thiamine-phosphate kinase [Nitrospirae bacterium]|nr:thiamine-monophosphate kinase [bacterium BMS3Abin10]GBE39202.1 thiamine-monophosphate kinase [bacterium BMS3Bbin08]HDH50308.1 thiamine-phosphate kinase [Nitrospirota bacterium]HDK17255.1 thiamine-phosphate kinase [Nitrospirota bacterium]HDK41187.1 thiamine-phosphate kinase [Nitrospirota bacterium]